MGIHLLWPQVDIQGFWHWLSFSASEVATYESTPGQVNNLKDTHTLTNNDKQ